MATESSRGSSRVLEIVSGSSSAIERTTMACFSVYDDWYAVFYPDILRRNLMRAILKLIVYALK